MEKGWLLLLPAPAYLSSFFLLNRFPIAKRYPSMRPWMTWSGCNWASERLNDLIGAQLSFWASDRVQQNKILHPFVSRKSRSEPAPKKTTKLCVPSPEALSSPSPPAAGARRARGGSSAFLSPPVGGGEGGCGRKRPLLVRLSSISTRVLTPWRTPFSSLNFSPGSARTDPSGSCQQSCTCPKLHRAIIHV